MKRRELLNKLISSTKNGFLSLEKDTRPLDEVRANHLLRRLAFQPTIDEVNSYLGKTPEEVVEKLLGDGLDYLPENEDRLPDGSQSLGFIGQPMQNPRSVPIPLRNTLENQLSNRYQQVVDWIIDRARNEDLKTGPAVEKLTHFLMSIWCIEFNYDGDYQIPANSLYQNNQTLRKYRLGSYKEIAKEMTLDGAFLLYQSAHLSRKEAPNENYARELLELFTMGIGHYSEGDIQELAKIMTGWRTSPFLGDSHRNGYFQTWLDSEAHYTGSKRVMSMDFPALTEQENNEFFVKNNEIGRLINGLFDIRQNEISRFIATKIFIYFVYSNPDEADQAIIEELAETMRDNDFNLLPVFQKLFTSKYFFDEANLGCQIKTPLEFVFGLERILGKNLSNARQALSNLEQVIFNPPNVSGWTGYRTWISTTTYPHRVNYATSLAESMNKQEILSLLDQVYNKQNPTEFLREIFLIFFPKDLETQYYNRYKGILLKNGLNEENWLNNISNKTDLLSNNIRDLLIEVVKSPLFHLC